MTETKRLEEIFSQAMQLPDGKERVMFVEQACDGDVELAQHVSALLNAAQEAGSFLESPVRKSGPAQDANQPTARYVPTSSAAEFPFLTPPLVAGDLGSLGPYRILNSVGRGGMGIVFRALDPKLQRVVAIKVLAPEIAVDPMARKRFEREARSAAAVSHPHCVVIHAVDEAHQPPYIVMEFIQGKTLADKIAAQGALSVKEILRIGAQVAEGLAAAHKQGLVHRDMKPTNVLLENGVERAKVADFGLAKTMDDAGMTRTGELSGTPQYMSPEQASGAPIDHRTDLFSLGAILYTMCTGRPPFQADNALATLKRICEDAPRPIERINPEIPDWLSAIVERLLAKSPADRYQTAAEVAALLQKYLAMVQKGSYPAQPPLRTQPKSARHLRRLWPRSILACGLLAGIGVLVWIAVERAQRHSSPLKDTLSDSPRPTFGGTPPKTGNSGRVAVIGKGWQAWPADAPPPAIAPFDAEQAKAHQDAWAKYLKVPVEYTNSLGMQFRLIPPGEFTMGSTPADMEEAMKIAGENQLWQQFVNSEGPQHKVILTQPIYLGATEVTQAAYEQAMGTNPSHFSPMGPGKEAVADLDTTNHPVDGVSWNDAAEFCAKLSQAEQLRPCYFRSGETVTMLDGAGYRLPTEAEWEFACRAGTTTKYWIGDNDEVLSQVAWITANSGSRTHTVGELKGNPFGLFDIHGNVWEWVQDWWDLNYYAQFQEQPAIDPGGPSSGGSLRVIRGSDWKGNPPGCRSSDRDAQSPTDRTFRVGFRVALPVDAVKAAIAAELASPVGNKSPDPFDGKNAGDRRTLTDLNMAFRWCPPGNFTMGSPLSEMERSHNEEQVKVTLSHGFWLGETEVTQGQWEHLAGTTPWKGALYVKDGSNYAVSNITYAYAMAFVEKLTSHEREAGRLPKGWRYSLPTEAQWEYACRANTTTKYGFGDNESALGAYGWYVKNTQDVGEAYPHPVGQKQANAWGLKDMHGNLWEWCSDWYGDKLLGGVDPVGPASGSERSRRGGGWGAKAPNCRSATRGLLAPDILYNTQGFRVAAVRSGP